MGKAKAGLNAFSKIGEGRLFCQSVRGIPNPLPSIGNSCDRAHKPQPMQAAPTLARDKSSHQTFSKITSQGCRFVRANAYVRICKSKGCLRGGDVPREGAGNGTRGRARYPEREKQETSAQKAVQLRKSLRLKLPDAIILATADEEGCILVTRNTKDFKVSDPRVRIPYAAS